MPPVQPFTTALPCTSDDIEHSNDGMCYADLGCSAMHFDDIEHFNDGMWYADLGCSAMYSAWHWTL